MQQQPNIALRTLKNVLLMLILPALGILIPYGILALTMPARPAGEPMFRDGMTPLLIFGTGFFIGSFIWLILVLRDIRRYAADKLFVKIHTALLLLPLVLVILSMALLK